MAFPTSPTIGDAYNQYKWNGEFWEFNSSDTLAEGGLDTNSISWPGHDNRWISTGVDVNAGSAGGSVLIFASVNTSDGNMTRSAMYFVRLGYDENYYERFYVSGSSDFIDFRVSNSILELRGIAGNNTARIIYYR